MKTRLITLAVVAGLVLSLGSVVSPAQAAGPVPRPAGQTSFGLQPVYHIVQQGETLWSIARLYGVTPQAIAQANGLVNPNLIYPGQRLLIPMPGAIVHVVRAGETLSSIGRLYGVSPFAIAQANNLMNPDLIYVGQRLVIPRGGVVYAVEAIVISQPLLSATVTSPVRVTGFADPTFEQNLVVQVRDVNGNIVGSTPTTIQADIGQRGPYSVDVTFTVPSGTQAGRIEVFAVSPRDGQITHLSSVEVTLQGP